MKLSPARVGSLVWVLIYGGLLLAGLGFALQRNRASFGWPVAALGAFAAVAGVVLLWVRSRMAEPPPQQAPGEPARQPVPAEPARQPAPAEPARQPAPDSPDH